MSVDPLADKIHELRGDRQSLEWWIADRRVKSEEPSDDVFAELNEIVDELFMALDIQAEGI